MQNCIWLFFWETKRAPSVISVSGGFMHLFFLLLSRRAWFVLNCHVCSSTILYVFLYGIERGEILQINKVSFFFFFLSQFQYWFPTTFRKRFGTSKMCCHEETLNDCRVWGDKWPVQFRLRIIKQVLPVRSFTVRSKHLLIMWEPTEKITIGIIQE